MTDGSEISVETEDKVQPVSLSLATALLDEDRRRFEASERRFDDLRNRARTLAAAVAALLALDVSLLSTFSDPAKNPPGASIVLAMIGTSMHLLLLRQMVRAGYAFEPGRGLPKPADVATNALKKGHLAMITDLWKHYLLTATELEERYANQTVALTTCSEQLANSLAFPTLAVFVFASTALVR